MAGKFKFSYILMSIIICVCMNVMFSGKVKAGVEDDVAAAVAAGMSHADAVTNGINAGANPAKAVIVAITLGGPGVAGEVTKAAISAGGIDVAGAVTAAAISAGGDAVDVVMTAYHAGANPVLLVEATRDIVDMDILQAIIDALGAAGVDTGALVVDEEPKPPVVEAKPVVEQPQDEPASSSS